MLESRSACLLARACGSRWRFASEKPININYRGLMLGMLGAVAVYALIQGVVRRDTVFTLFALWLASFMCHALVFLGYGYRYFWPQGGGEVVRLTGVMGGQLGADVHAAVDVLFALSPDPAALDVSPSLAAGRGVGRR